VISDDVESLLSSSSERSEWRGQCFHGIVSVCLSVCVHAATCQSDIWALNVNSSKTVKATHFRFDAHVSRSVQIWSLKFLGKGALPWSR